MRLTCCALLVLAAACRTFPPSDSGDIDTDTDADTDTDTDAEVAGDRVRVVTWNVQYVGGEGSEKFDAAAAVLARLDADVVALNEIEDDQDAFELGQLAYDLGYSVIVPDDNPYGDLRNAMLTRLPVVASEMPDAPTLSGDAQADDLTRLPVAVTVTTYAGPLTVIAQHWKSGWDDDDDLRRIADAHRTAQAADRHDPGTAWVLVAGDVNAEVDDMPDSPASFSELPPGLPSGYWLGADLYALMTGDGLQNNPFLPFTERGFVVLDALQIDGTDATRPTSGRRLDYVMAGPAVPEVWQTEVFDCRDEGDDGLPKSGEPLAPWLCSTASDHLPVVVDLAFPSE